MASYNFYEIENELAIKDKVFKNDLFGFNDIDFKKINDNFNGYLFFTCHISKDYKDTIFIFDNGEYKENNNYKRIGKLELFIKNKIIFVRGNYIDRVNFNKALKNTSIYKYLANPKAISLNLLTAIKDYEEFTTLSIKDFSATINKLRTSGKMSIEDEDINDFINRSDDITATTIIYPFNDDEYDIHIDKECKIRLKDGDFDGSIEQQLDILSSFYEDFIVKYKDE